LYFVAATLAPRSPRSSKSSLPGPGDSSPSKAIHTIVGLSVRGLIPRASSTTAAVPPAPSFAPTKPSISLVS
jgi:hypothetical protein